MPEDLVARWDLIPTGEPILTSSSALQPVIWQGRSAMLKVARIDEERRGAGLMRWWDGEGAASVFIHEGDALLMERATGLQSLTKMSAQGKDDEATRIICTVANRLHAVRKQPLPELAPLSVWFRALGMAALAQGGVFAEAGRAADDLLMNPQDVVALHGDIHHGNILDFGPRGWLAIDPKGLHGERSFDFANLFCNPDESAADPACFDRRVGIVCEAARLDRKRLLNWILAWSGLSAAFSIEDGDSPDLALAIAQLAAARLS